VTDFGGFVREDYTCDYSSADEYGKIHWSLMLGGKRFRCHWAFSKGKGELVSWVGLFAGLQNCPFFSLVPLSAVIKTMPIHFSHLLGSSSASSPFCFIPGADFLRVLLLVWCFGEATCAVTVGFLLLEYAWVVIGKISRWRCAFGPFSSLLFINAFCVCVGLYLHDLLFDVMKFFGLYYESSQYVKV